MEENASASTTPTSTTTTGMTTTPMSSATSPASSPAGCLREGPAFTPNPCATTGLPTPTPTGLPVTGVDGASSAVGLAVLGALLILVGIVGVLSARWRRYG